VEGGARRPDRRDPAGWRALRRRRRRRRLQQATAWLLLGASALGLGFGLRSGWDAGLAWVRDHTRLLEIRAVNVASTRWTPSWEVADASGLAAGDDLLSLDLEAARERVVALPRVAAAELDRRWNREIVIRVREREPLAVVAGDGFLEIGFGGIVLGGAPGGIGPTFPGEETERGVELPLLTGFPTRDLEPGSVVDHRGVRRALAFLDLMEAYGFPPREWISEIRVDHPDSLVVYLLQDGTPVRVGTGRMSRTRVEALLVTLDQLAKEGSKPEYIDLRFVDQVVVGGAG
jgi:cell division protein FtsQ